MFFAEPKYDFEKLAKSLSFESGFEQAAGLLGGHLIFVQKLLNHFLAQNEVVDEDVRQGLSDLPQEHVVRLLSSPYLCESLMILYGARVLPCTDQRALSLQILKGLVAEIIFFDPGFVHSLRPVWTFNGDVVLDPRIAEMFPPLRTRCGIQLNYQSQIHNTLKEGIGGYDHAAGLSHLSKIESAKALIQMASPSAVSLVEQFTLVIQFRQNKNRPSVVNSSSHTSIGLIRCDNFHRLHADLPEVIDMLVHESIHQYLHLFEEQLFAFVKVEGIPAGLLNDRNFPSPWSGHLLDLRSYTHAILVWYGLVHFWRQFIGANIQHPDVSRAQALSKLQEAEFGFRNSRSVLDNLGSVKSLLQEDFILQIERIQKDLQLREAM